MTGQGLKFTDVLPGSFQLSFRIQQVRRQRSFPGADFPGTYSFRSYPQNLWITVAPLLREKALLTA